MDEFICLKAVEPLQRRQFTFNHLVHEFTINQ